MEIMRKTLNGNRIIGKAREAPREILNSEFQN